MGPAGGHAGQLGLLDRKLVRHVEIVGIERARASLGSREMAAPTGGRLVLATAETEGHQRSFLMGARHFDADIGADRLVTVPSLVFGPQVNPSVSSTAPQPTKSIDT
jgi:hypothetical protein